MDSNLKVIMLKVGQHLLKACAHNLGVSTSVVSILAEIKRWSGNWTSFFLQVCSTIAMTFSTRSTRPHAAYEDSIRTTRNFTRKSIFTHRFLEMTLQE